MVLINYSVVCITLIILINAFVLLWLNYATFYFTLRVSHVLEKCPYPFFNVSDKYHVDNILKLSEFKWILAKSTRAKDS